MWENTAKKSCSKATISDRIVETSFGQSFCFFFVFSKKKSQNERTIAKKNQSSLDLILCWWDKMAFQELCSFCLFDCSPCTVLRLFLFSRKERWCHWQRPKRNRLPQPKTVCGRESVPVCVYPSFFPPSLSAIIGSSRKKIAGKSITSFQIATHHRYRTTGVGVWLPAHRFIWGSVF